MVVVPWLHLPRTHQARNHQARKLRPRRGEHAPKSSLVEYMIIHTMSAIAPLCSVLLLLLLSLLVMVSVQNTLHTFVCINTLTGDTLRHEHGIFGGKNNRQVWIREGRSDGKSLHGTAIYIRGHVMLTRERSDRDEIENTKLQQ
jgi:hypothetical protein